jgi:hypothetical protein
MTGAHRRVQYVFQNGWHKRVWPIAYFQEGDYFNPYIYWGYSNPFTLLIMKHKILVVVFSIFTLSSCVNYFTAKDITKNSLREYNGIDTLIKINGYYFETCEQNLCSPFFLSKKGEFVVIYGVFHSHDEIHNYINTYYPLPPLGNYSISNDTIKAKFVRKYDFEAYDIFEEQYIIQNDTTLIGIYRSIFRNEKKEDPKRIIYKFYPYKLEKSK